MFAEFLAVLRCPRNDEDLRQMDSPAVGPSVARGEANHEGKETDFLWEGYAMKTLAAVAAITILGFAAPACAFEISSPAIGSDNTIPLKYTANSFGCSGPNVSLPLVWKDVPADAKSLTLTMYDPDAPTGSGFWHWLVANLPPTTTSLGEGAGQVGNAKLPAGAVQARGDAGVSGYFGPCPPQGDAPHRYVITIFAVKADKLDIDANTSGAVVGFNLHFNAAEKASVTYTYGW
jgi:Raf kinase inhibitor-like YbhB/YbcL family protein